MKFLITQWTDQVVNKLQNASISVSKWIEFEPKIDINTFNINT